MAARKRRGTDRSTCDVRNHTRPWLSETTHALVVVLRYNAPHAKSPTSKEVSTFSAAGCTIYCETRCVRAVPTAASVFCFCGVSAFINGSALGPNIPHAQTDSPIVLLSSCAIVLLSYCPTVLLSCCAVLMPLAVFLVVSSLHFGACVMRRRCRSAP